MSNDFLPQIRVQLDDILSQINQDYFKSENFLVRFLRGEKETNNKILFILFAHANNIYFMHFLQQQKMEILTMLKK
jgi:hypothetical protein